MKKSLKVSWLGFVAAAVLLLGSQAPAAAYQTEYAVVVVVDGARICETFGDDPSMRPSYCPAWDGTSYNLIPGMWNTLAPQGSLGMQVFNTHSQTTTLLGTTAIVAGKNTTWTGGKKPYYMNDPGAFEYIRKDLGLPQSGAHWFTTSLTEVTNLPWMKNNTKGYGPTYKPTETHTGANDTATYNAFKSMLLSQRPRYNFLHIWDIDTFGHNNNWSGYQNAITVFDGLMVDLWNSIQADATLANQTALIIVGDHGRDCGNFQHHATGDSCCRQVNFLALGPDFKQNYISMSVQDQRTVTKTLGELIGFTTPYADGTVFTDIIQQQQMAPLRVSSINMSLADTGPKKHGVADTVVIDGAGQPVIGAEVMGQWSQLANNFVVAPTDETGVGQAGSNEVTSDVSGQFVWTVTDVQAMGYQFDPGGSSTLTGQVNTSGFCVNTGGLCTPGLSSCCNAGDACFGAAGSETCQQAPVNEIHVADIQVACNKYGKNWRGDATVTVTDGAGNPMSGVNVSGQWSGADGSSCNTSTTGAGTAVCSSGNNKDGGTFTLTVNGLSLGGYTYNPAADVNNPNSCTGQ